MLKNKNNFFLPLFFLSNLAVFVGLWFVLLNFQLNFWVIAIFWLLDVLLLHNFFNLTHLASHNQTNSNKVINQFIGNISALLTGITLPSFRSIHLLHHRFVGDEQKDPDHFITNSGLLVSIPFKIWYHDFFYFKHKLWQKDRSLVTYLLTRLVQVLLVLGLFLSGNLNYFVYLWLLNMLLIGLLNGLYLFYIPHYELKIEKSKQNFLFKNSFFTSLKISRFYHALHHLQVKNISAYFPISNYLILKFKGKNLPEK
jgi:beta-carotene hydroxylase